MPIIQILGTGCAKCQQLAANARAAVESVGGGFEIQKVTDIQKIVEFGVMSTPALALDGKVLAAGRVLSAAEITKLIQ